MSFDTLKKHTIDIQKFPKPIVCSQKYTQPTQSIITLLQPFFDHTTGQHLSAGTRFVEYTQKKSSHVVFVYVFDPIKYHFNLIQIPKTACLRNTPRNKNESIDLFMRILKLWAHQSAPYVIPYVLGGCSFIHTYPAYQFSLKQSVGHDHKKGNAFIYNTAPSTVASGFDCSGIILRAAQMARIPYFCKNTSAIAAKLKPLANNDRLQNGDLIWIPGHVIIVADTKKNTIIEARGYDQGYGKVHEIPIEEQFKHIKTFQNLVDAYRHKKPLVRLNRNGAVVQTIANYKLFKLSSVWD